MFKELGTDIVDNKTGSYNFRKNDGERYETIKWWATDAVQHLEKISESFVNSVPNFDPSDVDYLHTVYSCDHGQKKLRSASKLLLKMKDQDTPLLRVYPNPIADVDCKKDNGAIFKNTILPTLQSGINKVTASAMSFYFNETTKKWECKLVSKDSVTSNCLKACLCGDLKFLFMMLGREDFDTFLVSLLRLV
jgi:hypothetical protein